MSAIKSIGDAIISIGDAEIYEALMNAAKAGSLKKFQILVSMLKHESM